MARTLTFLRDGSMPVDTSPKLPTGERKLNYLYADKMAERKNRGGLAGGLEYIGASAAAGVGGVLEGTLDLIGGGIAALTGDKAYAEYLFENNVVGDWHKRI
jgi:hypothetical protein